MLFYVGLAVWVDPATTRRVTMIIAMTAMAMAIESCLNAVADEYFACFLPLRIF